MKKQKYLLLIMCVLCTLLFGACSKDSSFEDDDNDRRTEQSEDEDEDDGDKDDKEDSKTEEEDKKGDAEGKADDTTDADTDTTNTDVDSNEPEAKDEAARLTSYNWQGTQDGSLLVFEQDGTFRYYQSAEDLTDYYFEGTYEFHAGADAVEFITTDLSQYSVTKEELTTIFDNNEQYDESNFVCFALNNEACYMDGENAVEEPYQTSYFGFCLEEDGDLYLDIANMTSANYHLFIAK